MESGYSATLHAGEAFWAEVPEDNWPADDALREKIMTRWDIQFGDLESEVVFVDMDIENSKLRA